MLDKKEYNIKVFNETKSIYNKGSYVVNGKEVALQLTNKQREEAIYISKEEVNDLINYYSVEVPYVIGRMNVTISNDDSYEAARECNDHVLVLNFANSKHPGGGVEHGAIAQEEGLCRSSSLYQSLTSNTGNRYYVDNRRIHDSLGSDAIILSPNVEVIRDNKYNLLDSPKVVSVITCAAPNISYVHMTNEELYNIMTNRIKGVLVTAIKYGYKELVLGAWGCGAFRCNPNVVAKCFYDVLKTYKVNNHEMKDFFTKIVFAIMGNQNSKNYKAFNEYFSNFYKVENETEDSRVESIIKEREEKYLDTIKGCMFGGAIGDALGYPVEFDSYNEIQDSYGTLDHYVLHNNKALISDDTQMSLFTANGILYGDTRLSTRGIGANPHDYVRLAYKDWLYTQYSSYKPEYSISWLLTREELFSQRAPGNTCLNALMSKEEGDTKHPLNHSKGCGGIMRVAPLALYYGDSSIEDSMLDREGAEIAAITHGHSLGYMPSAALTHILRRIMNDKNNTNFSLYKVMKYTTSYMGKLYKNDKHIHELTSLMYKAIDLANNSNSDIDNIRELGEGWVAEETLAIAMYCALRHQDSFDEAIIAAINHSGDSDSTGAVTGNIMGALVGYSHIHTKWLEHLECKDIIEEISIDLCDQCQITEYSSYRDPKWEAKYIGDPLYAVNKYLLNM